jgi:Protein of unknown function (DUF3667)
MNRQGLGRQAVAGEGEIIGDMAQAALTARAVEPAPGEGDEGHTDGDACLNCGTVLAGSHCHACGQAAHIHRTLGAFFHDLLHGVLHFEGKVWRTLPLLAWNPGRLTREYIDGRRASYVSPIALFLFVAFLTYAVFNLTGSNAINIDKAAVAASAEQAERDALAEIARLEQEAAQAAKRGERVPGLDGKLQGLRGALEGIRAGKRGELPGKIAIADSPADSAWAERINAVWRHVTENPELALYKLQANAYKYSWLLIPLSVPFLWLLFPLSRRFHLYDHTIFVTYSLCFMLVLLSLGAASPGFGWLTAPLALYAPFHLYRQLRGTYGLSRRAALLRLPLLLLFATWVLALWGLTLLALVMTG